MLRKIFILLLIVLLATWVGTEIAGDPGYAFFAYGHWTVEMPLWLMLGFMIIVAFIVYIFVSIMRSVIDFGIGYSRWKRNRRYNSALKKTNQGLMLLAEGKWNAAEKVLVKSAKSSQTPFINYLAAARAAQEQEKNDQRDRYLELAQEMAPNSAIAVGLTQVELQLGHQQLEHALATLRHLHGVAPKHQYVLKLLVNLYRQLNDWHELSELLPHVKRQAVYNKDEFAALQLEIHQHLLQDNANDLEYSQINEIWHAIPKAQRKQAQVLVPYIQQLKRLNFTDEAESLIRAAVKSEWQLDLVYEYGLIQSSRIEQQLHIAEHWLKEHGHSMILLLTLGRLAVMNQLWGQAKNYFEQCLKLGNLSEARSEYGELLLHLNDRDAALEQFRLSTRRDFCHETL